jgi:hypothetical protein
MTESRINAKCDGMPGFEAETESGIAFEVLEIEIPIPVKNFSGVGKQGRVQ